ncbi:hypothetical protein U8V97_24695, partial [Priestia filamentosa]|uniref:hypothetical protein n=1 Tax=Priestia filamentosa TaxID=1402861 RepID=UPI0039794DF2
QYWQETTKTNIFFFKKYIMRNDEREINYITISFQTCNSSEMVISVVKAIKNQHRKRLLCWFLSAH